MNPDHCDPKRVERPKQGINWINKLLADYFQITVCLAKDSPMQMSIFSQTSSQFTGVRMIRQDLVEKKKMVLLGIQVAVSTHAISGLKIAPSRAIFTFSRTGSGHLPGSLLGG